MFTRLIAAISAVLLVQTYVHAFPAETEAEDSPLPEKVDDTKQTLWLAESKHQLIIMDFLGKACGDECNTAYLKLKGLEDKYPNVVFVQINIDDDDAETKELKEKYKVTSLPYTVLVKNKQQVEAFGDIETSKIEEMLKKHA